MARTRDDENQDRAADGGQEPDWPWFLPAPEEERAGWSATDSAVTEDPGAFAALHAEIDLVVRAVVLLELVGERHEVTESSALPLVDVRTLVERWELPTGAEPVESMWDVPELVGPWTALTAGGWIELTGTGARPGEGSSPYVPAEEDPDAFILFARALMGILLLTLSQQEVDQGGFEGGADTFAALFYVTSAEGLTVPDILSGGSDMPRVPRAPGGGPDLDQALRLMYTISDLTRLSAYGLVRRDSERAAPDTHYRANLAVMAVVASTADLLFHGPDQS
ncbi:hypothetical protein BH708_15780 [Brachybacterium sp. P6-10-X1]|uniref:hypothetical protein n=1 Tax=Brachybacterium sp. P6-10-X1 TaxID=1903186 RepID=UPI000971B59F|nr:hypothetical protein [Brachybacterium sp. P6-10-X1]APX33929.1 hypothetical protein BH708_15780 [Brachybacterium sp. P6-10-X1]